MPTLIKRLAVAGASLAVAASLSGCITAGIVKDLPPEAKRDIVLKVLERCGGSVNFNAGGASGQLGGGANASFQIIGTCPVPEPAAIPQSQLTTADLATPADDPPN
jgi:hypothetical protein